ncbi:hypothetical protein [Peribacillus glennii]|uniref:Uncharacterized protein n=1 Tax=Peribacillus glennii TaxID=2303991 RepID=A0A372L7M1_9BACI|nr:hypothetical protein [Peribacillus glennii]RFU60753.1 hypothetical protein D0466_20590 [Peribacillus glennii]
MAEVNMKIRPSFQEEECAIVFSFSFNSASGQVGVAVVYTCEEKKPMELTFGDSLCREKIAFVKEFEITEEYRDASMKKMTHFLNILGIKKCIPTTRCVSKFVDGAEYSFEPFPVI